MAKRRSEKSEKKSRCWDCEHRFHLVKIFPQYNCLNDSLSIIAPNYHAIFVCEGCGFLKKQRVKFHEDDDHEDN